MTRPMLLTIGWASLVLGCSWSHSALAQGTTLLPPPSPPQPPTSLPLQNAPVATRPDGVLQTGANVSRGEVRSRVVARVNGEPILEEEIMSAATFDLERMRSTTVKELHSAYEKQILNRALEDLIMREAIIQDANLKIPNPVALKKLQEEAGKEFDKRVKKDASRLNLKTAEDAKQYYEKQGKSLELMRRAYVRQAVATEWVRNLCRERLTRETTREALLEYYQTHADEFKKKERVEWQHIFVDVDRYNSVAEARHQAEIAWQLLKNAKTETDFNTLVDKYADGISKARRGVGDGNFKGEIKPKELEQFVFAQPAGGQGPVVETSRGYYVFRVTLHTPAETISFEKASIDLKKKLENKILEDEYNRLGKEMRERTYIEMLNQNQ